MSDAPAHRASALADAVPGNLAERLAPPRWRPWVRLARLDRPTGWWLLLLPCWQSAALAALADGKPWPEPWHLLLFLIGAVVMRGAGSTWNDILDRKIDAQVARTRARPLPAGDIRVSGALVFLVAQALIGLAVLLQFNTFAIILGLGSLIPVAVYPLMKRLTSWPQAVLGLAFSWGALMGWAATFGSLSAPAFLLYGAAIAWTIGYDTIYALQDARDDAVVGVRSTARLFGAHVSAGVGGFYAVTVVLSGAALWIVGSSVVGWMALTAYAAHLAWQVMRIAPGNEARALALFRSNRDAGLILFVGLCLEALISNG